MMMIWALGCVDGKSHFAKKNTVNFFFGLVRIRPLRSVLTISEPWDEGDGFE